MSLLLLLPPALAIHCISLQMLYGVCRPQSFYLLPHPAPLFHLVFVFLCRLLLAPSEYCKILVQGVLISRCCVVWGCAAWKGALKL